MKRPDSLWPAGTEAIHFPAFFWGRFLFFWCWLSLRGSDYSVSWVSRRSSTATTGCCPEIMRPAEERTSGFWTRRTGCSGQPECRRDVLTNGENTDISIAKKYLNRNSYYTRWYPRSFYGSWAQRTGSSFAGEPDDFSFLIPNFETKIIRAYDWNEARLEENFYFPEYIDSDHPSDFYDQVLGTQLATRNMGEHNGKKMMLIGDSFSRTVNPFFMLSFEYFDFEDGYSSSEITKQKIEDYQPDIIILIHSPWNNYGRKESFEYRVK